MADFASPTWFDDINARLATVLTASDTVARVVFSWSDGPSASPHAMTLEASGGRLRVSPGDHLAADAVVTLSFLDASALADGTLDTARALREGRMKLKGDAAVVVQLWSAVAAAQ
jgi:hypothetical protein